MNYQMQEFARRTLKEGLAKLNEGNHRVFKLVYGRGKAIRGIPARSVEEAEKMPINDVVDEIPDDKLDWAMQQVERSLVKLAQSQ